MSFEKAMPYLSRVTIHERVQYIQNNPSVEWSTKETIAQIQAACLILRDSKKKEEQNKADQLELKKQAKEAAEAKKVAIIYALKLGPSLAQHLNGDPLNLESHRGARAWVKDSIEQNLLLLGPCSTGKTVAGLRALVAKSTIATGQTGQTFCTGFYLPWDAFQSLSQLKMEPIEARALTETINTAKVLMLDDLRADATSTKACIDRLEAVLDRRKNYGLKTIITSNATQHQFLEHYGDRIKARLIHSCKIVEARHG